MFSNGYTVEKGVTMPNEPPVLEEGQSEESLAKVAKSTPPFYFE